MLIAGGMYGLHMGEFAGPVLRWVYFFFGLAGTAVIGSGLVMAGQASAQARQERHPAVRNASGGGAEHRQHERTGARRGRLLLGQPPVAGDPARPCRLEINAFFGVWSLALLHALLRPGRRAWGEQLALAALLCAGLPLLNGLTSGEI